MRGKRLRDILDGDRLAIGEALMRDVLAGEPRRFARQGVAPDGRTRMMEVTSVPHAVAGEVVGVVTVVYDVSSFEHERRTVSDENVELAARVAARTAELAASEAFVRAIADNVPTSLAAACTTCCRRGRPATPSPRCGRRCGASARTTSATSSTATVGARCSRSRWCPTRSTARSAA